MAHPPSPGIVDHPEGLQEIISRRLMHAIIDGSLPSGEKLSPTKLASEFGVSHIPVREALAALEAEGYVRRAPRVGFFVAELPTDDVGGVYHWRQVLEDEAHRIAVPRLEDSDLARMRKLNDSINRERESQNRFLDLDREFHFVAFGKAGSEILLRLLNQLWDSVARYQKTMDLARVSRAVLRDHAALIEAFEARDVNLVNALMAEHRGLVPQSTGKITTRSTRAAAGA